MKFNPYFEVIVAAMIWGTGGAFIKYLDLPPSTLTFFRLAIPTAFFFIYLKITRTELFKKGCKIILFASSLNVIRIFLFFVGFTFTTIGNAVIVLYTWPIFAAITSHIYLKEKLTRTNAFMILIAFLGVIFLLFDKNISMASKDFIGIIAMLISAAISGIVLVIFKKEMSKFTKYETVFYQNLVGSIIFLPAIFINNPIPTITQTSVALIYGLLIGVVSYTLFFSALKKIKVAIASYLSYIEVLVGVVLGILFFKEVLTWNMLMGGILIIIPALFLRKN